MKKYQLYKIFLLSLILSCSFACGNKSGGKDEVENSDGKRIIETGELAAVNSKAFILQRYARYFYEMKIIGLLEHGSIVNEGDSIIQLDPTDIKKFIIDREGELETQKAALQKLIVDQDNKLNEIESTIKNETATYELKKIELEASRFESDKAKKIKELEFEQATINFNKVKRKLELNKIIDANDYKIQEIRVNRIQTEITQAEDILPQLVLRTPISGVFQVGINWRYDLPFKVGDGAYPGMNMANVPELKWMKVNTFINENDFLKIHVGQKVAIRLDALPKVVFNGEISYMGRLCRLRDEKSRQKGFDVEVKILESDERLKPGMTVSCEFLQNN